MSSRNPRLLSALPTPFLSLASHQLAGRGRGSNVWLSPSGCLQYSLVLRVSTSSASTTLPYLPANKLVFVQYLFALAIVEACRDDSVLGPKWGQCTRIKWPNDLYAVGSEGEKKKIGGVLVNTSFSGGGKVDIVIGSCCHSIILILAHLVLLYSKWLERPQYSAYHFSVTIDPRNKRASFKHGTHRSSYNGKIRTDVGYVLARRWIV